jgi:hypothetical membrane protein
MTMPRDLEKRDRPSAGPHEPGLLPGGAEELDEAIPSGSRQAAEGAGDHTDRRDMITLLAAAGIVGPIVFTLGFLAQEFFRRGEYSPMAEPVSALEAGPNGWIQQVNFVVFGLLTIAYAVGLHLGVRPTRAGVVGPAILAWSGVGLVLAGVLPLREDAAGVTYDATGLHIVNGMIFFLSLGPGLITMSRRLARDPRWRNLATYALATGIALLIMFVAFGRLVAPDDAPLHPWAGLAQRVAIAVWFACTITLALRLLRAARTANANSTTAEFVQVQTHRRAPASRAAGGHTLGAPPRAEPQRSRPPRHPTSRSVAFPWPFRA